MATKDDLLKLAAHELGKRGWREQRKALEEEHGDSWEEEYARQQAEYGRLRGLPDKERLERLKEIRARQKSNA